MAVIADFAAYPEWAASVKTTEVLSTGADGRAERVQLRARRRGVKDEYELEYVWTGDERVDWDLVRARCRRAQHGSYALDPARRRTEVTYSLTVDLRSRCSACSSARPSA